jgi:hypothetical protein
MKKSSESLKTSLKNSKPISLRSLMNIWVWGCLFPGSFLFFVLLSNNLGGVKASAEVLNAAKSIEAMEKMIKPAIQQATDWSVKAGLGFVSASAFYALVVRVTKL